MTRPEAVSLEEVGLDEIEPLIEEEIQRYREWYRWDFSGTAELVKRLVATHSLRGVALVVGRKVVGYSYIVADDYKALIGDVYVAEEWATPENERLLMASTVEEVHRFHQVRRVESQPMLLRYAYSHPRADRVVRCFLEVEMQNVKWPEGYRGPQDFRAEPWNWRAEEDVAQLVHRAYRAHMDAEINDQYRMASKARTYLANMTRYPGCGMFHPESSYLVWEKATGRLVGATLTNVADWGEGKVGHIAQVCVDPEVRRQGIGRLLMLASLSRFGEIGCEWATLTVTARNHSAYALYESLGFEEKTRLAAYVWPIWPV